MEFQSTVHTEIRASEAVDLRAMLASVTTLLFPSIREALLELLLWKNGTMRRLERPLEKLRRIPQYVNVDQPSIYDSGEDVIQALQRSNWAVLV